VQVHQGLKINTSRDGIILIIVGYVWYSTIGGGSSQHSAVVLFDLKYVAMQFRSVLFQWRTIQFSFVVWKSAVPIVSFV